MSATSGSKKRTTRNIPGGKLALDLPYQMNWPQPLESDMAQRVVMCLIHELAEFSPRKARTKQKSLGGADSTTETPLSIQAKEPPTKRELCCGITEVTKALERKALAFVILLKDSAPAVMLQHIPLLCQLSKTKLIILPSHVAQQEGLAKHFGFHSLVIMGFYPQSEDSLISADIFQWLDSLATLLSPSEWLLQTTQYLEPKLIARVESKRLQPVEPDQKKLRSA